MSNGDTEKFTPPEYAHGETEVSHSLMPVIERMARYLPIDEIQRRFTSSPSETGGVQRYPYCRVDSSLIVCRNYLHLISLPNMTDPQKTDFYHKASNSAMEAVLWVEIGFEGLQNLATDSASKNWTSGVGHIVDDKQREQGIMTGGKEIYDSIMQEFVKYRKSHGITDDCFSQFNLEWVLEKWDQD